MSYTYLTAQQLAEKIQYERYMTVSLLITAIHIRILLT